MNVVPAVDIQQVCKTANRAHPFASVEYFLGAVGKTQEQLLAVMSTSALLVVNDFGQARVDIGIFTTVTSMCVGVVYSPIYTS